MTRIMTIASGLAQVGKTHLAINLALELVRRGWFVGVFEEQDSTSSIENFLVLQEPKTQLRRADDTSGQCVSRRGYQGVDVLSCRALMQQALHTDGKEQARCVSEMDIPQGYDDFLIDTSGFGPRTLLACCRASAMVILVVTPELRSQAEAFGLLKILQLNGYSGELRLVVNKVPYAIDAEDIHKRVCDPAKACLGYEIPLLGLLPEDEHIPMAQSSRQAFTSLFPDLEVAGSVVAIADGLDAIPGQGAVGPQSLPAFWRDFLEIMELPVNVSGGALLERPASS